MTFSPITFMVFDMHDHHVKIFQICDEDDTKEKVICTYNEEMKDQNLHISQKQLPLSFDLFLTDFSPEVPFPPPKNM